MADAASVGPDAGSVSHEAPRLSLHDLLKRICDAETPRARATDPSIPLELDAICGKAMSKRREDRYLDAKSLVADLRRFLSDEPVSACPEPLTVHVRRWMQQHRTAMATTAAMFLMSFLGLLGWGLLSAAHTRTVETANAKLQESNRQLQAANTKEREATQLAREQSQLALKSLESVIFDIQRKLKNVPGAGDLQRSLLQTAVARLQEVSDRFASRSAIDRNTYVALIDLGDVFLRIGSGTPGGADADGPLTAARKVYQQALEIAQKLAAADPSDAQAQRDLSVSYDNLGDVQLQSGQVTEALGSYQKGLEISQKLAAADPSDAQAQLDLVVSFNKLGQVNQKVKEYQRAIALYEQALVILKRLKREQRLAPVKQPWIASTEELIAECQKALADRK